MAVFHLPPPAWLTHRRAIPPGTAPADVAEALVEALLPYEAPIDVESLISYLGITVHEEVMTRWSGAVNSTATAAAIWVRATDSHVRKRFTLAHELGHLMLHDLGVAFRDDTFSGGWKEVQANRFAAALLMPALLVRRHYDSLLPAKMLARTFQVSEAAMRFRLAEITGKPAEWII